MTASSPLFGDIYQFETFLTDEARGLYNRRVSAEGVLNDPSICEQPTRLLNDLRYLYTIVKLDTSREPSVEDVANFAEMFNHGVSIGMFEFGVHSAARWKRLSPVSDKAIMMLNVFSQLPQRAISTVYSMHL